MHFNITCFLFHSIASQPHALHNLEAIRKYFNLQWYQQPTRWSNICFIDSFKLALYVSGDSFAHLQEHFDCTYSFLEKCTDSPVCCWPVTQIGWIWMKIWCRFMLWSSRINFMFYTPSAHKQYVLSSWHIKFPNSGYIWCLWQNLACVVQCHGRYYLPDIFSGTLDYVS